MFQQTIALFRFQLPGIINTRIVILLGVILLSGFLGSQFIAELAIINSEAIAFAALADYLRYCLVLVVLISLCFQISQDYELNQFERLLAMPISRYQYLMAETLVLMVLCAFLVIPTWLLLMVIHDAELSVYWACALYLELVLVGHFALLAGLSLVKLPVAVIFTLALYVLSKSAPVIDQILANSSVFYAEESGFQFSSALFTLVRHVLPGSSAFAQNNLLFESLAWIGVLSSQLGAVILYSLFLQAVILVDFYRREFAAV